MTDSHGKIENLLFDLDGTLTDPRIGITASVLYALKKMGVPAPPAEELLWCIGPPLHNSFLKLLGDRKKVDEAVQHYRERYIAIGMYENQIYHGIHDVLAALKHSGCTLHVATSKLKSIADKIIDHFEFRPYFTNVYGSEVDGTRGDKGDLIAFILKQEDADVSSYVMIGDREHDMIGARKNQIRGIGVGWGYGTAVKLTESGAETVLFHPNELLECLTYPTLIHGTRRAGL